MGNTDPTEKPRRWATRIPLKNPEDGQHGSHRKTQKMGNTDPTEKPRRCATRISPKNPEDGEGIIK
jgi:hypothetical protein